MMIGIVLVVGISQFNRILGGVLGVVFWTAVAFTGLLAYDQGGAIGILDIRFPREIFVGLCLLFVGIHAAGAWSAWKRKRSLPPPRTESDMQGDD